MQNNKVLMAMSGGIDSSVAALLLKKQGYDVIGITMKTWDYATSGNSQKETGCCNLDTINDARAVAVKMGFPHYILDLKEEFAETIIKNFIDEYMAGRTPNPCVLCNALIKWDALLRRADMLGCRYIATGHYARIISENNRYVLYAGNDGTKDQSYVLWQLTQDNLSRTLFPLGELTKNEVRQIASNQGFENLVQKRESYEICFIPDDDYRAFLRLNVPDIDKTPGEGNFVDTSGGIIGKHKGYPFYTIGQRKGLDVAVGYPLYVKKIDAATNTITLAQKEELSSTEMLVGELNLISMTELPAEGLEALVKVRYKDAGIMAHITPLGDGKARVSFHAGVSAITPGQSAVFVLDKKLLGGGIILE